jgi:hypothetical protein
MDLSLTHLLIEMNTRNLSWGGVRPVGKAENLTTTCPSVSQLSVKYGSLMSHNLIGLHGLLQGKLYCFFVLLFIKSYIKDVNRLKIKLVRTSNIRLHHHLFNGS